uniref:Dermonecrotic toxin LgSicTox-beta-LOXN4 (Fragments) n=1 Tax=Loxosceles gaucho TaxID=58216 RepID=BX4_LOXGA|nr:RecName: Full=Dermonecrotic toxin LgSicTox-beta-LOXN4; AltName: Full=Phospholipase D; Short=PLD; AltName: Full=Sphingomyelin phosphodiesterase D; Short=SMD; Short=SMase D; Short=Sphingomyelinase D [Loxosceles gaucho]
ADSRKPDDRYDMSGNDALGDVKLATYEDNPWETFK